MPCNCRGLAAHAHLSDGAQQGEGAFGVGTSLNDLVQLTDVKAWNVREGNSEVARRLLKVPRDDDGATVRSDVDSEVLLVIPFTEVLRLRGVSITSLSDASSPNRVRLFVNRTEVDGFDSVARLQPTETIALTQQQDGDIVYRLNQTKFASLTSVVMLFDGSYGSDEVQLQRINFYGESTTLPAARQLATNVTYEVVGNPADHEKFGEDHAAAFVK